MTWPPNATRAEILRILEINRIHPEWVITRAETEAVLGLLGALPEQWRSEAQRLTKNLATLQVGIEYAHRLHTPEGMPDEPENCAHPACSALATVLATLAPGPKEGRDG